jgi:hypothetical protein
MTDSVFDSVRDWANNSPMIIIVNLAALAFLVTGMHFFVEDAYSNYRWAIEIQNTLGIRVGSWASTYRLMAVFPQLAQTIFLYTYMSDRQKNKWAAWAAGGMFLVDYIPDVWWRGNNQLGLTTSGLLALLSTNLITFGYYTIGSEIAVSFGFGTFVNTWALAIAKTKEVSRDILSALTGGPVASGGRRKATNRSGSGGGGPMVEHQRGPQPKRDPNYRRADNASNGARTDQHSEGFQPDHQGSGQGQGHNQAFRGGSHPNARRN